MNEARRIIQVIAFIILGAIGLWIGFLLLRYLSENGQTLAKDSVTVGAGCLSEMLIEILFFVVPISILVFLISTIAFAFGSKAEIFHYGFWGGLGASVIGGLIFYIAGTVKDKLDE